MIPCDRVCPPVRVNCLQEFMDNAEQGDLCIVMRYYTFFGDMVSYESFWFFFLFLLIFYILCIVVFMYNRNLYNRIKGFFKFYITFLYKKDNPKNLWKQRAFRFSLQY